MKTSFQNHATEQAKDVILCLNSAIKSTAFFPYGHDNISKALSRLEWSLNLFLEKYESLTIRIHKGRMFYNEDLIMENSDDENNIGFLFSRDGIEWFEFHKELKTWETRVLLQIINNYRTLNDTSDENLVTALWQYEFKHFQYGTVNIPLTEGSLLNFSNFKATAEQTLSDYSSQAQKLTRIRCQATDDDGSPQPEQMRGIDIENAISIADTAAKTDILTLTDREKWALKLMVNNEHKKDDTDSVLEILLITLLALENKRDSQNVLDFIYDRYLHTLAHGTFDLSFKILKNLKRIFGKQSGEKAWASIITEKAWITDLLNDFFTKASGNDPFEQIQQFFQGHMTAGESKQIRYLGPTLRLLNAHSIIPLMKLIENVEEKSVRRELFSIVMYHGQYLPNKLQAISKNKYISEFFPFINTMEESDATRLLVEIVLQANGNIRRKSLEKLIERNISQDIIAAQLFSLIEDKDKVLKSIFLSYLGRNRSRKVELLIDNYLRKRENLPDDRNHILSCYQALGQCGSQRSIPFLKKTLQEKGWSKFFNQKEINHKEGAAIALYSLGLKEADAILKEAADSLLPSTRSICRKLLQQTKETKYQ